MDLELTGKIAWVTGSTAGIGFSIAKSLAIERAYVYVNGRAQKRVDAAIAIRPDAAKTGGRWHCGRLFWSSAFRVRARADEMLVAAKGLRLPDIRVRSVLM
jgi:NAD(P)-dependent dehydrogenase (short-subunit alcohol dehydrogenase family)